MSEWSVTLPGRVISKKNSKQVVRASNGRTYVVSSKAYEKWQKAMMGELLGKKPRQPFDQPISLTVTFALKGKIDADLDNLEASISDLLQDAEVITNDKLIVEKHSWKRSAKDFSTYLLISDQPTPPPPQEPVRPEPSVPRTP